MTSELLVFIPATCSCVRHLWLVHAVARMKAVLRTICLTTDGLLVL